MRKNLPVRMKSSGMAFTMIEVLVAIMLISILSAMGSVVYRNYNNDARATLAAKKMLEIRNIIRGNSELVSSGNFTMQGYLIDMGRYPTSLDELVTQGAQPDYNPFNRRGWRGPYISSAANGDDSWKNDPWGRAYVFDTNALIMRSCGPDGVCENDDDIVVSMAAQGIEVAVAGDGDGDGDGDEEIDRTPDAINGGWSAWSEWYDTSACIGICKTGSKTQRRTRSCNNPAPAYGGSDCVGKNNEVQTISCILDHCPIHGGWTEWSEWAESKACDATCGVAGTREESRTRSCTKPTPQYGGTVCAGDSVEVISEACTLGVCPINGAWNAVTVGEEVINGFTNTYENQSCNNPIPAYGGAPCVQDAGWTYTTQGGILTRKRPTACGNGGTPASNCASCEVGQDFLPNGICGNCSGTINLNNQSIGALDSSTNIGTAETCAVNISGNVTVLGSVVIRGINVAIDGTLSANSGGKAGGAGGRGGNSNCNSFHGCAGTAGSAGSGSSANGGALGARGDRAAVNATSGANGSNGTGGTVGTHASAKGQTGGGGGGGGGAGGGGYGKHKFDCGQTGAWDWFWAGGGGGGGGAGGRGGGSIEIYTDNLSGSGSVSARGEAKGGNGAIGTAGSGTTGGTGGNGGTATAVATSLGRTGGAGAVCPVASGSSVKGGDGGNGGNGGAGGDGSIYIQVSGEDTSSLTINSGSGYYQKVSN